jgi:hypothetical protein
MRSSLTTLALATSVMMATGCGEKPSAPATQQTAPASAAADDHHHGAAPHGGTITDWGGGVYHVEFTVDHDAKSASVYILGSDGKSPEPVKADKILLSISDPAFQVELNADPLPGELGGMSSRFVGTHDNLGIVREFAGTVSGEVEGTPYVGEFSEVAGDHGHEHSTPLSRK